MWMATGRVWGGELSPTPYPIVKRLPKAISLPIPSARALLLQWVPVGEHFFFFFFFFFRIEEEDFNFKQTYVCNIYKLVVQQNLIFKLFLLKSEIYLLVDKQALDKCANRLQRKG